jgi:hypothetical protein
LAYPQTEQHSLKGDRRHHRLSVSITGTSNAAAPIWPAAFLFFPLAFSTVSRLKEEYLHGKTFRCPPHPR